MEESKAHHQTIHSQQTPVNSHHPMSTSLGIGRRKDKNNYWKALKNTDKDQQLPLYKDKPEGHNNKRSSIGNRRLKTMFKAIAFCVALYSFYHIGWFLKHEAKINTSYDMEMKDWKFAQTEVKRVFKESWAHYEAEAWGKDVYNPLTKTGKNMGPHPLGWIIVDSLDTLHLMGLDEEFKTATAWVANELTYDIDYEVNVFETTIRMLGGLLSAYFLSQNDMFLDKAVDLGDRLLGAFESPSGLPYASVNLKTKKGVKNHVDNGASSTAEVSTLQLEFKYLSKLTGESLYWEKVEKIMQILDNNHAQDGLVPIYVHPDTGRYQGQIIRLGSRGDSYYEYLLKQYLQTEQEEPIYNLMYQESLRGMKDNLLRHSKPNNLAFFGELEHGIKGPLSNKMDHLVCFIGGLFALGATDGQTLQKARKSSNWSKMKEDDMLLAKDITHTCYEMYHQTATGLAPEIVVFNTDDTSKEDFYVKPLDRHNLQRPETVESLFILYRITGDPIYRKWGWEIFKSFEQHTKTPGGSYTSLQDVTEVPPKQRDNMESFWLAETLKYLYLLFDDEDLTPLDKVVFNTEAHPLPKFSMNPLFKTGWSREKKTINADDKAENKKGDVKDTKANVRQPVDAKLTKTVGSQPKESEPPRAAQVAKPALVQLKELSAETELETQQDPEKLSIKQRLQDGENVNEILEELIEL